MVHRAELILVEGHVAVPVVFIAVDIEGRVAGPALHLRKLSGREVSVMILVEGLELPRGAPLRVSRRAFFFRGLFWTILFRSGICRSVILFIGLHRSGVLFIVKSFSLNFLLLQLLAKKSRAEPAIKTCLIGIHRIPAPAIDRVLHLHVLVFVEANVAIVVKTDDRIKEDGIGQVWKAINFLRSEEAVFVLVQLLELVVILIQSYGGFDRLCGLGLAGPIEQGGDF